MRVSWNNIERQFVDIKSYIPKCPHCNPLVLGIPFIYTHGQMFEPESKIIKDKEIGTPNPVTDASQKSGINVKKRKLDYDVPEHPG